MSRHIGIQTASHPTIKDAVSFIDFSNYSNRDIYDLFREILDSGMHGLCFSLYGEGQGPGDIISEDQVRRRMEIIRPYTNWIRSFSCTDGNELIPIIAREYGIKTLVGAWLGKDEEINKRETEGLIQLSKEGYVDIAAVGNEVLYRRDMHQNELLDYILKVKAEVDKTPVGYVDAYYEFSLKPQITNACDIILSNCYPFWEGTPFEYSISHMQDMYRQASQAGENKKVIITETGWPSQGENHEASEPSVENAMKYFIQTQLWAKEEDIDVFYFSSFDESWKQGAEGVVGAYWGIWDKFEKLKYI